jgi:hypothetical protein
MKSFILFKYASQNRLHPTSQGSADMQRALAAMVQAAEGFSPVLAGN